MSIKQEILKTLKGAKQISFKMSSLSGDIKDRALSLMSKELLRKNNYIIRENQKDLKAVQAKSLPESIIDRLRLDDKRINDMSKSLAELVLLRDPVGDVILRKKRPNKLIIKKVRVPIGVVLIIFESRPNVTSDSMGLCLKSGNVSILRGGSEAIHSNAAIFKVLKKAALRAGVPEYVFNFIRTTDRKAISFLLKQDQYIDLVMPRGGEGLIRQVSKLSRIPVIKHYKGICSVYVDRAANLAMAEKVTLNAKLQRPSVCNAIETLLVHKTVAKKFLPRIIGKLRAKGVEIRGCSETCQILSTVLKGTIKKAKSGDWSTEYLDLILAVKVVKNLDAAIEHINHYGSHHSDSIITGNQADAAKFLRQVDSAVVFSNASTRFTDGHQFGMGAEIGISTDKLHARGPMGLEELTTYKYQVYGNGQIRK